MRVLTSIAELRVQRAQWRDERLRVAFVPTMGNLHDGHLALIARARALADRVVASIFVNPLQFGAGEDFDDYPRTFERDRAALEAAGCDLLFAPGEAELYPNGRRITQVAVPELGGMLCGEDRPGHFDGVTTVVALLFNIVGPDCAVFGQKDYQQLQIIRRMVRDLHMPVEIVGEPTRRETDGLAMSSRNQYLSEQERALAPQLHATLQAVAARLRAGAADFSRIEADGLQRLQDAGFLPVYLRVLDAGLGPPQPGGPFVVAAAARLGRTRLIDNVVISD